MMLLSCGNLKAVFKPNLSSILIFVFMQTSLFEPIEAELKLKQLPKNSLIISIQAKQPLTPQQQSFNRLIKKIEKLRGDLEKTSVDLNQKLDYYAKHIHPLEHKVAARRKEVVKLVFSFFNNKKLLSKPEKKILKSFFAVQLEGILAFDKEPDDELKKIFKIVNGISLEEAAEQDFELRKDEMQEMFESEGYDVDFKELKKDMTPEEMMAKLSSLQEKFLKQEQTNTSKTQARKKTAKLIEKEKRQAELVEARNKNIRSIFKQLAKALHPDLEQDEIAKLEKEGLMKRLTIAYNSGDLHSMLSLELEWIHKEEESITKLSKEKLAIYNQVLKEQVQDLEQQKFDLVGHPRYNPLRRYSLHSLKNINVNLPIEKRKLEETVSSINDSIVILKGKNALREIKMIIQQFKDHWRDEDDFGLIEFEYDI
jgi:hypothetical protein